MLADSATLAALFPRKFMSTFLTVSEAVKLTGKSASSIRRLFKDIRDDPNHPDRHHVQPSVDEVLRLREKGENFPWRVSEEFLRQKITIDDPGKKGSDPVHGRPSSDAIVELLSMLQKELEIKNQQLAQQNEMLAKQMQLNEALTERLREGNVLMGSLQQQLTLPQGSTRSNVVDASASKSREGESDAKIANKATSKPTKSKKGLFRRLFS